MSKEAESRNNPASLYSVAEEVAHSATHGAGLLLSIAGLVILIVLASTNGNAWHVVSVTIFGTTLVILYGASTFYHAWPKHRLKQLFRTFDHSAIYLLIAGTYTPFTLVNLRGGWGWALFGVVWGLAVFGIVLESVAARRMKVLSVTLYVGLGWLVAIAVKPLLESVPAGGLILLLSGGMAYTGGVVFYAWRKIPFNHTFWHVFVVAGSVCHYMAVVLYVIPRGG